MKRNFVFLRVFSTEEKIKITRKGFTLPELLLAAGLLSFALSAILLAFISSFFLNEQNRNLTLATSHAQYIMEEIKTTDFANITNDTINATDGDWPPALKALPSEVMSIQANQVNGTNQTLLDVEVAVNWKDRGLRDRNTSLRTYIIDEP